MYPEEENSKGNRGGSRDCEHPPIGERRHSDGSRPPADLPGIQDRGRDPAAMEPCLKDERRVNCRTNGAQIDSPCGGISELSNRFERDAVSHSDRQRSLQGDRRALVEPQPCHVVWYRDGG